MPDWITNLLLVHQSGAGQTEQRRGIEENLVNDTRRIQLIENQKISQQSLRELYGDFAQIYSKLNKEKKRKLTQAVISEITCRINKKESVGQIQIAFRGDGTSIRDWDMDVNPEKVGSSFRVDWLRVRHENSNSLKVNLPILIQNTRFGGKIIVVDCSRILNYLSLDSDAIKRLADRFSYMQEKKDSRPKRDGLILAQKYSSMLDSGAFCSRAELARFLGVSRARVAQVLTRLNKGGKS